MKEKLKILLAWIIIIGLIVIPIAILLFIMYNPNIPEWLKIIILFK